MEFNKAQKIYIEAYLKSQNTQNIQIMYIKFKMKIAKKVARLLGKFLTRKKSLKIKNRQSSDKLPNLVTLPKIE